MARKNKIITSAQPVTAAPTKPRVTLHIGARPKKSLLEQLDEMHNGEDEEGAEDDNDEAEEEGELDGEEEEEEEEEEGTDDDEDNKEQGEESGEDAPPTPKSLKRKRTKQAEEPESDDPSVEITYIVSIMSAAEARKTISKRVAKSVILQLDSNEPWDTLKAQLLVKIDATLKPQAIHYDSYDINFIIPRVFPKPGLSLTNAADYDLMISKSRKLKDITIQITVVEVPSANDKENEIEESVTKEKNKKKRIDPTTLPGNVNKNRFIQDLRDEHKCGKKDGVCPGTYCYDSPDGNHIVLSHSHIDCWASAMLKNDDSATLEKPPNHRLFDPSDKGLSPVLQRRQAAMSAQSGSATGSSAPIINFTLGNEALNFLRPLVPQPAIPSALPTPQPPLDNFSSTLLPSTRRAGPDMRLDNFCTMFDLGLKILDKFTTNDYLHARFLRFILIKELEEMGFTRGEIAALRDAVETWSIPFA